jgi:hypothetical protein
VDSLTVLNLALSWVSKVWSGMAATLLVMVILTGLFMLMARACGVVHLSEVRWINTRRAERIPHRMFTAFPELTTMASR